MAKKRWTKRFVALLSAVALTVSLVAGVNLTGMMVAADDVKSAPDLPDGVVALLGDRTGKTDGIGDNLNWVRDRFANEKLTPVDGSKGTYLELDFFISDLELAKENGLNYITFCVSSGNDRWSGRNQYSITNQVTKSGWNHVMINLNKADANEGLNITNLANYMLDIGEGAAGAAKDVAISIQNVCVTNWVPQGAVKLYAGPGGHDNPGPNWTLFDDTLAQTVDISGAEFLEFDFYMSDPAFLSDQRPSLGLAFSSSADNKWVERSLIRFSRYVTRMGWNHISIPMALLEEKGADLTKVHYVWCFVESTVNGNATIANVYATKYPTPTLPDNKVVVLDEEGSVNWIGGGFHWLVDRLFKTTGLTATDFTTSDYVEFDLFVSDWAMVQAQNAPSLFVGIGSTDGSKGDRYQIKVTDLIKHSGWNHIKVPMNLVKASTDGSPNLAAIRTWVVWFDTGNQANAYSDIEVRIRNICGTVATTDKVSVKPALPQRLVAYANDADSLDWAMGGNFFEHSVYAFKKDFSAMNATGADNIEFDLFVGDYDLAKSQGGFTYALLFLSSNESIYQDRSTVDISAQITKSGWNHISFKPSDLQSREGQNCDVSKIQHYLLEIGGGASGYADGMKFGIANFCATQAAPLPDPADSVPEKPTGVQASADDANCLGWSMGGNFFDHSVYAFNKNGFTTLDATKGQYLEFDFYVGNYAIAKAAGMGNITFGISSGANWSTDRSLMNVTSQITKSGWNHVKFKYTDMTGSDGSSANFSALKNMMFAIDGQASGAADGMKFGFANLCVTGMPDDIAGTIDTLPAMPENVVAIIDQNGTKDSVGNEFAWVNDRLSKEQFTQVDLRAGTYLEFDLYVGNLTKLKNAGMDMLRFAISSAVKSDTVDKPRFIERTHYDILSQVKTSGWNHIKIAWSNDSSSQSDNGTILYKAIRNWGLLMGGKSTGGAVSEVPLRVGNVCLTVPNTDGAYPPPAMQPNPVVVLDEDGFSNSKLKDMIYEKHFDTPVDLTGAKYLEFDVYVENYAAIAANTNQGFSLSSGDNKWDYRAHYQYTNYLYADGWNHVRIPIDEILRYETGNQTDMRAVTHVIFYTETGATPTARLVMANFCATNPTFAGDTTAPTFTSEITTERQEEKGITISWNAARDNLSMKPEITYTVYYSKEAITAANLAQATKFASGKNMLAATARGLEKMTGYFFAITATDAAGNATTVYSMAPVSTVEKSVVMNLFEGVQAEVGRGNLENTEGFAAYTIEFHRDTNATSGWYNNLIVQHPTAADYRDMSSYNAISLNLFVSDLAKYESIWKAHTYIVIKSGTKGQPGYQAETFPLKDYTVAQGWNNLVIDMSGSHVDLTAISSVLLATFPLDDTDLGYYPSDDQADCNTVFKLAKIQAVDVEKPAYSFQEMENATFLLPGTSYVFMAGVNADHPKMKALQHNTAAVDISKANYIEFDFYIEDLEALKDTAKFGGLKLRLLGEEDEYLPAWRLDFTNQVTKSGWNHIKIDMTTGMPEGEWNAASFRGVRLHVENTDCCPTQDIKMAFKNLYATAKTVIEYPKDANKPARPDKNALYISDCEGLAQGGTWNPDSVWLDTDNKTEGKASIGQLLKEQGLRSNSMRFVLTNPLNLKNAKTLKFDLWVSDPELLAKRASMSVRLTSDRRGYADFFNWKLDLTNLKSGWNSIEIDLTKGFTTDGNPDLSAIRVFHLLCDEASFVGADEEEVTIKVDNVRAIGADITNQPESNADTGSALPFAGLAGLGISGLAVLALARKKNHR